MAAGKRPHASPLLVVERILLVLALAALGWYGTARATAVVYQAWQGRQLDTLMETQQAQKGRDKPLPAEGAPRAAPRRSLVGRLEVPRLGLSAIVREGATNGRSTARSDTFLKPRSPASTAMWRSRAIATRSSGL